MMGIVVVFTQLLVLLGGSGVFPCELVLILFNGISRWRVKGSWSVRFLGVGALVDVVDWEGASRMSYRVMSLGWCARTLIRVAWGGSVWPEDDVT